MTPEARAAAVDAATEAMEAAPNGVWLTLPGPVHIHRSLAEPAVDAVLALGLLADPAPTAGLRPEVERGVECYHGTPRACESYRCGSNCSQRFDRMHPCPACLVAEIQDLRAKVTALGGDPYAPAPTAADGLRDRVYAALDESLTFAELDADTGSWDAAAAAFLDHAADAVIAALTATAQPAEPVDQPE